MIYWEVQKDTFMKLFLPSMVRPVACEQLAHDNYNPVKNPPKTW